MQNKLNEKLKNTKVKYLSKDERDQVWQRVLVSINEPQPNKNFLSILIHKPMISIILTIILVFGGSVATVAASDSAKPGDFLFPVDRAVENVRISLASDEKKDKLKVKFALERAEEIKEILKESAVDDFDNSSSGNTATSTIATTTNDTSLDDDIKNEKRIEQAFATALEFIAGVKQDLADRGNATAVDAIDQVIENLNTQIDILPDRVKFEVEREKDKHKFELEIHTGSDKQKIKFESEDGKFELEAKTDDGKAKIKMEDDGSVEIEHEDRGRNSHEDNNNHGDRRDDNNNEAKQPNHNRGLTEAEARINGDVATVEIEFNDQKHFITVYSRDREVIIDSIVNQFNVSREDAEQILKIEIEGKDEKGDDHGGRNKDDSGDDQTGSNATGVLLKEIKAEIEDGVTKVKVEFIDDTKDEFTLTDTERDQIVAALADKYAVSEHDIEKIFEMEKKN